MDTKGKVKNRTNKNKNNNISNNNNNNILFQESLNKQTNKKERKKGEKRVSNLEAWWLVGNETDALHLTFVVKSDDTDE